MKKVLGFSLIELLIGLALTSLLMSLMIQHYAQTKRHYQAIQLGLERIADIELITQLIRDRIRKAGFTPCLNLSRLDTANQLYAIKTNQGRQHALNIGRMSEKFDQIIAIESSGRLITTGYNHYKEQDVILIADCFHAERRIISHTEKSRGHKVVSLERPLMFDYVPPIYVGKWINESFFIQPNRQGKLALFYQYHHSEQLTSVVNKISASSIPYQGKTLVNVTLGIEDNTELLLETNVRSL